MHTYPFHGGDFLKDTAHFDQDPATVAVPVGLVRDLAYRRLLDLYYSEEAPIPNKTHWVATRVRLLAHAEIVGSVLKEKFVLKDGFWHQKRADEEIAKYQKRVVANQENGKKGGRKPTENPTANPLGSKPRTITITNKAPLPPEGAALFDEFWSAYPNKASKPTATRAFAKAMGYGKQKARATFAEIMAGLALHVTCTQWVKDAGQFIPLPATWLNADKWNDTPLQPGQEGDTKGWWNTAQGWRDKGMELRIPAPADESPMAFIRFRAAVMHAAGDGPWWDQQDTAYPLAVKLRDGSDVVVPLKREAR